MEQMIGDKYRIVKDAGSGGGGQVYQVYDCRLDKVWAAKRIGQNQDGLEEQVMQSVEALSFVRIVDRVWQNGDCFLIMDWIEGESLQQKIDRQGALAAAEAVKIGTAVCDAMEQLHTMEPPVLYLDCKPSNIMLGNDGRVILVDFGSAVRCDGKIAVPIAGSFGYSAPEQLQVESKLRRADCRSDIYSLGKTLYAALGGQCPDRPPYGTLPLRRVNGAVPPGLCQVIERCLAQDPEKRFQTAAALRSALKSYEKKQRCRKWLWSGLCAGVFILLFLAAWGFAGWLQNVVQVGSVWNVQLSGAACLKRGLFGLAAACVLQRVINLSFAVPGPKWEMKQSVLRTIKKQGVWMGLLLLFWQFSLSGQAAGAQTSPFVLRDEALRKLLLREGAVLEAKESVFIELDPELFQKDQLYEIAVKGTDEDGEVMICQFFYRPN